MGETHTQKGKLALGSGIVGIILIFIPLVGIASLVLGIAAIVFGYKSMLEGDSYGKIGLILGIIIFALLIVSIVVSATMYMYVTNMMP